jgi:hypothetical protein
MRLATVLWIWAISAALVFLILLAMMWGFVMREGFGALLFLSVVFGAVPTFIAIRVVGVRYNKRR